MNKISIWIPAILLIGVIFKLFLTSNGNFIFNMDNARDIVDVRKMVVLNKLRLTGPASAIEGLYNGPAWYYLLAIPFIVSGGNPYALVIMQMILWAIGGFFLLKLVSYFGKWAIYPVGLLWIASDYILLLTSYSFNPNPVPLLTPLVIYLIWQYLKTGKILFGISVWFFAGLFFNFEMNFGIFIPLIFVISGVILKGNLFLKTKSFWLTGIFFLITLLPQILFDLRHEFIMSKGVIRFLLENKNEGVGIIGRFQSIGLSFYNVFQATVLNNKHLSVSLLLLAIPIFKKVITNQKKDTIAWVSLLFILIPFFGYIILPVNVNSWHLGGVTVSAIILIGFLLSSLWKLNFFGKITSFILSVVIISLSLFNIFNHLIDNNSSLRMNPSVFKNEIAAIDYVYKYANGQNFKVYTYLPSVYDYPYQYLIWWYGLKEFGYLPIDYAYLPDRPLYISGQNSFKSKPEDIKKRENSNLVFLIKEPNHNYTLYGWEGNFVSLESIKKVMIGPLEIEIKKDINQQ